MNFLLMLCAGAIGMLTLEWLIPEGGAKSMAKFSMGLIYMAMLLEPIMQLFKSI